MTGGALRFSPAEAASFLAFFLLYSPCFAALSVLRREFGAKAAARVFLFQTAVAYAAAMVVYRITLLCAAG